MPVAPGPSRRYLILLVLVSAALAVIFLSSFRSQAQSVQYSDNSLGPPNSPTSQFSDDNVELQSVTLTGAPIMPHLGNETAKAELGRSAWRLLHTIMARFPDTPTADERMALQNYIHLFVRLYPCGECAEHFREIVKKFPPQVSSRSAAAAWACHVHNKVNERLGKDIFDCSKIGDFYDCGCADDEGGIGDERVVAGDKDNLAERKKPEMSKERKERLTGISGREFNVDLVTADISAPVRLEREGWSQGG